MKRPTKKVTLLEDIDVNTLEIEKDSYFPGAYTIDLPLDSSPDHVWQDIFEREWKLSRHLWDRKLYVVGDKLRLLTSPDGLAEKLDWVKDILKRTNAGVEQHNREAKAVKAETAEQARQRMVKEKSETEVIRDTLRKHIGTL